MSYFTLKNGEQLYYEDTGSGTRTIVMLHGWSSSSEVFAPVVGEISKYARCVTYDHRGHGGSKDAGSDNVTMDTLAGDLDELIRGLGLSGVTLLGWSMGAGVVMDYTALYGCGALRQIVLCDMTPKQLNDADWKLGLYQGGYTADDMARDANKSFYSLYKEFAVAAIPRLSKIPGILLRRPLLKILAKCDEKTLRSLSRSMKEKDFRECIGKITVPVSYFYAVPGSLFSPALADWYREHVNTAFDSAAFPESTHMLISDQPGLFADEVKKVLERQA